MRWNSYNLGGKSVSAKRLLLRPVWAEGTLNRSMTGILIYSVQSVFNHSPRSRANVKPFRSKPTLVTSKLKHDVTRLPRPRRVHGTPDPQRTQRSLRIAPKEWRSARFKCELRSWKSQINQNMFSARNDAGNGYLRVYKNASYIIYTSC